MVPAYQCINVSAYQRVGGVWGESMRITRNSVSRGHLVSQPTISYSKRRGRRDSRERQKEEKSGARNQQGQWL